MPCKATVSRGAGRVVLAYRGSMNLEQVEAEAIEELASYTRSTPWGPKKLQVGEYWVIAYKKLSAVMDAFYKEAKACGGSCQLWVTGHSLGGALASMAAMEATLHGLTVALYTFGQPRVGFCAQRLSRGPNACPLVAPQLVFIFVRFASRVNAIASLAACGRIRALQTSTLMHTM